MMFCTECGWTIPQVFSHTRDQLRVLGEKIAQQKHQRLKWEAELHGAKLKGSPVAQTQEEVEQSLARVKQSGIPVEVR